MKKIWSTKGKVVGALVMLVMVTSQAGATPITFDRSGVNNYAGSSGSSLSASVTFDTSGTNLIATLTNTGADVLAPSDLLTAVFFDLAGVTLGSVSAVLNRGSAVIFGGSDPGGVVGGEWAYGSGLVGAPGGATQGISSAGFGLFGASTFPGNNLQGPASVDGMQYGITSGMDNEFTGNAPVTGINALIRNSVVFTLSGLPVGFDPSVSIGNVSFQYGTALNEPNLPVPEPGTLLLLGFGLIGLAGVGRIII